MAVDTYALLPGNVRIADVKTILGKLAGLPHVWKGSGATRWVEVAGCDYVPSHRDTQPEVLMIRLQRGDCSSPFWTVHGKDIFALFYFFESSRGDPTGRGVGDTSSYPERIALLKFLV